MTTKMKAARAVDLLEYQDRAIVSRTLMKQSTGSVTLFAFAAGQELSEHTSPHEALLHVLEGEAHIVLAGRSHALHAGDLLLMPGGQPHAVRATSALKMMLTMIRS
jgi:quercetin dioxygenase-like cupin family protein